MLFRSVGGKLQLPTFVQSGWLSYQCYQVKRTFVRKNDGHDVQLSLEKCTNPDVPEKFLVIWAWLYFDENVKFERRSQITWDGPIDWKMLPFGNWLLIFLQILWGYNGVRQSLIDDPLALSVASGTSPKPFPWNSATMAEAVSISRRLYIVSLHVYSTTIRLANICAGFDPEKDLAQLADCLICSFWSRTAGTYKESVTTLSSSHFEGLGVRKYPYSMPHRILMVTLYLIFYFRFPLRRKNILLFAWRLSA